MPRSHPGQSGDRRSSPASCPAVPGHHLDQPDNPDRAPVIRTDGTVTVRYNIAPPGGQVQLEIFDVAGRLVRSLDQGWRAGGAYERVWDRSAGDGRRPSRGIYFVQLRIGGRQRIARKFVVTGGG